MDLNTLAIPHRAPFHFVKKIVDQTENSILTETFWGEEEPFFQGHYPGNPLVPGVILTESILQSGALLMAHQSESPQGTPVVVKIEEARFKRMVRPNEKVCIHVNLTEKLQNAYFFKAKMTRDSETILTLQFTCALT